MAQPDGRDTGAPPAFVLQRSGEPQRVDVGQCRLQQAGLGLLKLNAIIIQQTKKTHLDRLVDAHAVDRKIHVLVLPSVPQDELDTSG